MESLIRQHKSIKEKKVAHNTAKAWQVFNNSLFCDRKIIWWVEYTPVASPVGSGAETLPPRVSVKAEE